MDFEWDDTKAASNERKHDVSLAEEMTVFAAPLALRIHAKMTSHFFPPPPWLCPAERMILHYVTSLKGLLLATAEFGGGRGVIREPN